MHPELLDCFERLVLPALPTADLARTRAASSTLWAVGAAEWARRDGAARTLGRWWRTVLAERRAAVGIVREAVALVRDIREDPSLGAGHGAVDPDLFLAMSGVGWAIHAELATKTAPMPGGMQLTVSVMLDMDFPMARLYVAPTGTPLFESWDWDMPCPGAPATYLYVPPTLDPESLEEIEFLESHPAAHRLRELALAALGGTPISPPFTA